MQQRTEGAVYELQCILGDEHKHQSFHMTREAAIEESNRWPNCLWAVFDHGYPDGPYPIAWGRIHLATDFWRKPIQSYEAWLHERPERKIRTNPDTTSVRDLAVLRSMQKTGDWLHPPQEGPHTVETPIWKIHYQDGKEIGRELWNPKTEQWEGKRC
jgi:hypothetical protein